MRQLDVKGHLGQECGHVRKDVREPIQTSANDHNQYKSCEEKLCGVVFLLDPFGNASVRAQQRHVEAKFPDVGTAIVGTGPPDAVEKYHTMAKTLGLERTVFLGPKGFLANTSFCGSLGWMM